VWSTFGFPKSNPFDGLTIAGSVRSLVASVRGATAYQLFAEEAAAGSGAPMSGLSGSPVVVDGVAVALIRYGLTDEAHDERSAILLLAAPPGIGEIGFLLSLLDRALDRRHLLTARKR
jgi:hypothetical protein